MKSGPSDHSSAFMMAMADLNVLSSSGTTFINLLLGILASQTILRKLLGMGSSRLKINSWNCVMMDMKY